MPMEAESLLDPDGRPAPDSSELAGVVGPLHVCPVRVGVQAVYTPPSRVVRRPRGIGGATVYLWSMSSVPTTPYDQMGGDPGVRKLVDRFYDLIDSAPEAMTIRALHARSLKASREKLYLYLSMWTGGPTTYSDRFGHPRLRMRHFPFRIGTRERDEWLWCMDKALDEPREFLRQRLHVLADHMRNQE